MKNLTFKFLSSIGAGILLSVFFFLSTAYAETCQTINLKQGETLRIKSIRSDLVPYPYELMTGRDVGDGYSTTGGPISEGCEITGLAKAEFSCLYRYGDPLFHYEYTDTDGDGIEEEYMVIDDPGCTLINLSAPAMGQNPYSPEAPAEGSTNFSFQFKNSTETITANCEVVRNQLEVYAFYNEKETIIYQSNEKNYPELAFITIAAVETDRDIGTKSFYSGDRGKLKLKLSSGCQDIKLYNLGNPLSDTENAVFDDYEPNIGYKSVNWKGLYKALGPYYQDSPDLYAFQYALGDALGRNWDSGTNSINIEMDGSSGFTVIAVVSWPFSKRVSPVFKLETDQDSVSPDNINNKTVALDGLEDNIDLVRANVSGGPAAFTGDPGPFVVKGTESMENIDERLYSNIIGLKMKEAQGELTLASGGGPDWIQVAGADIYSDNAQEPFKSVLEIKGVLRSDMGGRDMEVSDEVPYLVSAAYDSERLRSNETTRRTQYGFWHNKYRDAAFWHESLHSYYFKKNGEEEHLLDTDNDELVVGGQDDSKPNYFTYVWDSKDRGFTLTEHPILNTDFILRAKQGKQGYYGDLVENKPRRGAFTFRIDDKISDEDLAAVLSGNTLNKIIYAEANIPEDFPTLINQGGSGDSADSTIQIFPSQVYIFNPVTLSVFPLHASASDCNLVNLMVSRSGKINQNGNVRFKKYYIEFKSYQNYLPPKLFELLKNKLLKHEYEMYVIFELYYKVPPDEFDADTFAITRGGAAPLF